MMDIYTQAGSKVVFTGEGGYDDHNKESNRFLKVGGIYTVDRIEVGSWTPFVTLKGIEGGWNTVMFENIDGLKMASDMARNKGEKK